MDLGISGRRAIVCAASKGLGRACAIALANEGVHVTITARGRPLARMLRLAGGAPLPEFFEIDDTLVPNGMGEQGTDMPHLAG